MVHELCQLHLPKIIAFTGLIVVLLRLNTPNMAHKGLPQFYLLNDFKRATDHGKKTGRAILKWRQVEPFGHLAHANENTGSLRSYHV